MTEQRTDLADVPFFSDLTSEALNRVRGVTEERAVPAGTIVCRRGDEGRALWVVASGGVTVQLGEPGVGGAARVFLGPGEVFGEMSILSGMPISGNVVAVLPSRLFRISRDAFLTLIEDEPSLQSSLMQMLIRRIRQRTGPLAHLKRPPVAVLTGYDDSQADHQRLIRVLERGVRHYTPGSELSLLPDAADSVEAIERWRTTGGEGQYLLVVTGALGTAELGSTLERGDAVLAIANDESDPRNNSVPPGTGLADHSAVTLEPHPARRHSTREEWHFAVSTAEVDAALELPDWDRRRTPALDRLVRWITYREIGIALGAGGARGFAHLGVIEVLEEAGVPIDCLAGSSMGGIVALCDAREGGARRTTEWVERMLGANNKIRDVSWWPRAGVFRGNKVRQAARRTGRGYTFAQLERPVLVATADLASSERVILDRGSVEYALLATSAIPALFPPVVIDGRILVDGALLCRIPVTALERRRCALTIAVNVIPGPGVERQRAETLAAATKRFLGFREVLSRSWELLGWWSGAADAAMADILIEPASSTEGVDFDAFPELVEVGRQATREKLDLVRNAVREVLGEGPAIK